MPDEVLGTESQIEGNDSQGDVATEDVTGLKNKVRELLAKTKQLQDEAKTAKTLKAILGDVAPEKLIELQEAQRQLEAEREKTKAELSRIQAEAQRQYEPLLNEKEQRAQRLEAELQEWQRRDAIYQIYLDEGGDRKQFQEFYRLRSDRLKWHDELKTFVAVDPDGTERFVDGKPMKAADLFDSMSKSDTIDRYFFPAASQASGSGFSMGGGKNGNVDGIRRIRQSEVNKLIVKDESIRRGILSKQIQVIPD